MKIETKLKEKRQRLWIWKEPDFFWFWNEDEPDFYGIFSDNYWFETASNTIQPNELKRILHDQLHFKNWLRAITVMDPRPDKSGVWRIVWLRRVFLLQNARTGRAIRFFPQVDRPQKSFRWTEMLSQDSSYFARVFWPIITARQNRLRTAFEFLDLPIEVQSNPIRFKHGNCAEFMRVTNAALLLNHAQRGMFPALMLQFDESSFRFVVRQYGDATNSRLERLVQTFSPYLLPEFAFHDVPISPFRLPTMSNSPKLQVTGPEHYTAHEYLEARMAIRDWLAANAPDLLPEWE